MPSFERRQLHLPIDRQPQPDRNLGAGGRSFYFFDFDDNVMHLPTSIFVFHRQTGEERAVSTREFARISHGIGKDGPWGDYLVDPDDHHGSFRRFRDHGRGAADEPFCEDLRRALREPDWHWKGPSWEFFEYAVFNQRPLAVITARGHDPTTLRAGISLLREHGHLACEPNYLDLFPVSHPTTRARLGGPQVSVPELKKAAIVAAVELALGRYGQNPAHRFGMSDDDPQNIRLIIDAMRALKARHPENAFFVIDASTPRAEKTEVFVDHVERERAAPGAQLALFE